MRPDEHKKKKNTEYKKKHGIPAKKESKREEIRKSKSEKPENSEEKQESTSRDKLITETRSFSRRKLASNWDRYEELEGESDDTYQTKGRRGADFATLLERTGDSHSQFQFQAEKEWEEEFEGGVQESQDVLKINFEDLSQSLNSLPLYKKLNLKEKEIYWDQLHVEVENDQRSTIKEMLKCIGIHDELENIEVNQKRSSNLSLNQHPKTQENETATSNLSQLIKDLSSDTSLGLNTSAVTGTLYSMGVIKKNDQLDDEELDFLLSLETSHRNSLEMPFNDKEVSDIPHKTDFNKSDIQVTKVDKSKASLPVDNNITLQANNLPETETSPDTQKPKEDLEDWLDSVLG